MRNSMSLAQPERVLYTVFVLLPIRFQALLGHVLSRRGLSSVSVQQEQGIVKQACSEIPALYQTVNGKA